MQLDYRTVVLKTSEKTHTNFSYENRETGSLLSINQEYLYTAFYSIYHFNHNKLTGKIMDKGTKRNST